jgi:beta-glucosidase
MWTTINEPWVIAKHGYESGIHAPGIRDQAQAVRAAHHLLLAHGRAVPVIRANAPAADIGIVVNLGPQMAASAHPADVQAARLADGMLNRWFLDPVAGYGYPQDVAAVYGAAMEVVEAGDMEVIAVPIDYVGINYYTRGVFSGGGGQNEYETIEAGEEVTDMGWEVYPPGLRDTLLRVHHHYQFPALYVTENGAAYADEVADDGCVHDGKRLSYYQRHLLAAKAALDLGVPLRGYYAWSLMDNFEWGYGLSKRFGLVHVDFDTQARTIKDSGHWYSNLVRSNGAALASGSED